MEKSLIVILALVIFSAIGFAYSVFCILKKLCQNFVWRKMASPLE
ncbi:MULTISPECIES: hypothetical protein [Mesoflavibacter]|nr:hypothetical protein [Mesoflavibacter zeaxanthinifaciens]